MRIAFNGQRLAGQRFGVGRYLEYLLRHWAPALEGDEEVTLFLRKPLRESLGDLGERIKIEVIESNQTGLVWENLYLRSASAKHDVLFCPAYSAPLAYRGRLVVANHSVNESEPAAHSWWYRQTYARLYRHCARVADAVIVPGARTAEAVEHYYRVKPERIHIVHQGADDAFHPIQDKAVLDAARANFFGSARPYILFVGKGSPRRNIPMLVEAFAKLKAAGFPHGLVLFGPYSGDVSLDSLIQSLGLEGDVVQTDGVIARHEDLVPIYAAADIFVHPSENEGWSMTTTEALACGTPVIASRRGGLGEVADGHAFMLDTPSVESLTDAMKQVLTDDELNARLRRLARERGAALRWGVLARQTLDIVRHVGRQGGSK
jgi:glycosyltransferase involved in cell wall biosynthesis